jgi:hypothetical protein
MTWAVLVAWALVVVVTLVRSRRHAAQLESVRR